jgi:alkyldihydroxyacetonephosphate synthase
MRWWGWGDRSQPSLPSHAPALLRDWMGIEGEEQPPVSLEAVELPESALPRRARDRLADVVGAACVADGRAERVAHAAGRSYPDLVRLRTGRLEGAPDAVVAPPDAAGVAAVLEVCADEGVAVVPFGGGTSVVGGVAPDRGPFDAAIALDLRRLDGLVSVDAHSLTAVLQGGVRLPAAESMLAAHGLTLGHFPQSFEYATVGGCVATRSAGQASSGYGRIDDLVLGLECVAPAGTVALEPLPASAAGPQLRELLVGSEGALGVITEAALRVVPRPAHRLYVGAFFHDFWEGAEAFRVLAQHDAAPDVARLSDEAETRLSLAMAGGEGLRHRIGREYLRARGYAEGCIAICGWEGERGEVARRSRRTLKLLRAAGALRVGRSPGEAWLRSRYEGPYLRDDLLGRGVMVETLETAAQWSRLADVYRGVGDALRTALERDGAPVIVTCHVSHLYESGASLYFTFMTRQREGEELEQWRAAKHAATDALVAAGGTLTHHHAVGRDHAPWLRAEVGDLGVALLRAAKAELDPQGIMNPGKLLPSEPPTSAVGR